MEGGQQLDARLVEPEWWEQIALLRGRMLHRHRGLCERMHRVGVGLAWLVAPVLVVVVVVVPEVRWAVPAWAGSLWLVYCWFLLAWTRTVSWGLVARMFAAAMLWAMVIALVSRGLALDDAGRQLHRAIVPAAVIAPLVEESLKLAPLAFLALLAPGRVRRFALVDWPLIGVALGAGFTATEEGLRRTGIAARGSGNVMARVEFQGGPRLSGSFLDGASFTGANSFAGHPIVTELLALGVAMVVWAARAGPGRWVVALSLGAMALLFVVTVVDHIGLNAGGASGFTRLVGHEPGWLPLLYAATGSGRGRPWLLLAGTLLLVLVDSRELARRGSDLAPGAARVSVVEGLQRAASRAATRSRALTGVVVGGTTALSHLTIRDVTDVLRATRSATRLAGVSDGRAVTVAQR